MEIFGHYFSGTILIAMIISGFLCYEWIFRSISEVMGWFKPTKFILKCIEWPFVNELKSTALLLSVLIFIILFGYQDSSQIEIINFHQRNVDIATVYGTIIGIPSMYGIYLGFLQFVISDFDKATYLGKNKVKYLTENSIWYQITQTKFFFCLLVITMTFPLFLMRVSGELYTSLLYAWQASAFMLICLYLFLITMSLEIILILFLVKSHTDTGMQSRVKNLILREYKNLVENNYANEFDENNISIFFNCLNNDLSNVEGEHVEDFFEIMFGERMFIFTESSSNVTREFYRDKRSKNEFSRYRVFLQRKWNLINRYGKSVSVDFYRRTVEYDLFIIKRLNIKDLTDEYNWFSGINGMGKVEDYLFDQLLNKYVACNEDLTDLSKWINKQSTDEMDSNEDDYVRKLEEYRWKQVFDKYLTGNYIFQAPRYFSEAYFTAVFDYLVDYYDNFKKSISTDDKYKNLIESADEEVELAAILYLFLYPENYNRMWVENWKYFESVIEEMIRFKNDTEIRTLILNAGKKIDGTLIRHRINSDILMELYNHKGETISCVSDFDVFDRTKMSKLFILFVEGVFNKESKYFDRLLPKKTEQSFTNELCINYLHVVDNQPDIVESESMSYSMKGLLERITFEGHKYEVRQRVGVLGLLYFEFIKESQIDFNTREFFIGLAKLDIEGDQWYFTNSIFEFFTLKIIDSSYKSYFNNSNFLKAFKVAGIRLMDQKNLSLDEYIQGILEKLNAFSYNDMGKMSMEIVKQKLRETIFQ